MKSLSKNTAKFPVKQKNMSSKYVEEMNNILSEYDNPKVLLHSCCAPCSSFCMLTLRNVAKLSVFYYNPNITDEKEYLFRLSEQKRLIDIFNSNPNLELSEDARQIKCDASYVNQINMFGSQYNPNDYLEKVKGYENCPERGYRCSLCFDMRLRETALTAKKSGFDLFATTLTLSPLKDAAKINEIGEIIAKEVDIKYLPTDFKKNNGYKKSIELSSEFNLYRQNYCGCVFSKRN